MRPARFVAAGCVAGIVAVVAACAREGAPPGGPVDRRPPVLARTVPDTFANVPRFRGPVQFVFDERISEKVAGGGNIDDAVIVSPHTGDVHVSHHRHGISVSLQGGFKPGLVYRVTLLPVLSDLFGNQMRYPVDLVFSTGAKFDNTALAGLVWNRITGKGLTGAVLHAVSDSDSLVYATQADSSGMYAFRYLPAGHYQLVAFQDQNQNGRPDFSEFQGRQSVLLTPKDTILSENLSTLPLDTTPARALGDTALDSATVAVRFDDYLDPATPIGKISVTLLGPDSAKGPQVARLFYARDYESYVNQVRDSFARLDSVATAAAAARKARGDTTPPPPLPTHHLPPMLPSAGGAPALGGHAVGGRRGAEVMRGPDGSPLPGRRIVALLGSPLEPGKKYEVDVSGVVNINGLAKGGGSTTLVFTPTDTAKADTAKADTAKARSNGKQPTKADTTHSGHSGPTGSAGPVAGVLRGDGDPDG